MSKKETLTFTCPCEKEHNFSETYQVAGEGRTRVQLRCPHPICPAKNPLLSFDIPHQLERNESAFKNQNEKK